MAIRQIRLNNDEVLRKKSKEVEVINEKIIQILNDMVETMYHNGNACGLACPQIGILKRIVVIDMGQGLIKLINPKIIHKEGTQEVIEGCLSIPGKSGKLNRPKTVTVQALNEFGKPIKINGTGDMAKCLCHEIDHLDGILYTDKVMQYTPVLKK
ncbi:MAG: def4 [Clostridiaceae bacterium]|jgi:peptide deformylase|nr:def4 [Clostridiaceae bacterium]